MCWLVLTLFLAVAGTAADRIPGEHWMRCADPADAGFDPVALGAAKDTWESMSSWAPWSSLTAPSPAVGYR
jgi:hypothetical protein